MTDYTYPVLDPLMPPIESTSGTYSSTGPGSFSLFQYSTSVAPDTLIGLSSAVSNYRLAFSSEAPTPRPSTGQIWPRGQGNRI